MAKEKTKKAPIKKSAKKAPVKEATEIKTKAQLIKESKKGAINLNRIKSDVLLKWINTMIESGNASRDYNMITIHW